MKSQMIEVILPSSLVGLRHQITSVLGPRVDRPAVLPSGRPWRGGLWRVFRQFGVSAHREVTCTPLTLGKG